MLNCIKTKIVATIGPASNTEEVITGLIKAGARTFRINSSHGTQDIHLQSVQIIRKVAGALGIYIPILLDLQGPKIRVGNLANPMELKEGAKVILQPGMENKDPNIIPVDYPGILNDVKKGDKILLNDGAIELKVLSTSSENLTAEVIYGGILTSRKGLNLPGTTTSISAVTDRDIEYIKFAVENNIDYLGLSFVRAKEDIVKAKSYITKFNGDIPVIAKIEKPQALDNLSAIITASDGVMVARGDLGIEISPAQVPVVQKQIIKEANAQRKAVIVATQMLESMIEHPTPTRAEASDVANAILDGTDAVMLSGETAVGKYPVESVNMMKLIAENIEQSNLYKSNLYTSKAKEVYDIDSQAIASAVISISDEIEINAIVAFTRSGFTGKLLSKEKPGVPIITISDNEKICRRLNLFWDILPHQMNFSMNFTEELLTELDKLLVKETFLEVGDKVIITGGIPQLATGRTNFVHLHQVGSTGTMY